MVQPNECRTAPISALVAISLGGGREEVGVEGGGGDRWQAIWKNPGGTLLRLEQYYFQRLVVAAWRWESLIIQQVLVQFLHSTTEEECYS